MVNTFRKCAKGVAAFIIVVIPGLLTAFFTVKVAKKIYKKKQLG